eukprot:TRINITY_DN78583_c0_g1_i1.p1 TRINITY_DN78583_c0_g1~~TRINITY_DN78583_c0_g1_i1.p1  ORF type:complete len:611 (+),score=116.00 TRINITY_DN78583_c0_g1_i1:33-1835(+)
MSEFPALPSPATEGVVKLDIEAFLEALHGPPKQGCTSGSSDLAKFEPRLLAVDVRSPSEYQTGHIPGAINIPLFDDDARAAVGTDYTRKGRYEAIRRGLSLAGSNFASFLDALQENGAKPGCRLLVYCWRGGMRSGSMGWLFSLCGYKVNTLDGGYRSYRRWCKTIVGNEFVPAAAPVIVLAGCTGVGKTAILHELRARGEQFLDLEGLANHRGSAFGSMGQPPQPSNEAYENVLALATRRVDPKQPLWIEHESNHVGKVLVPFGIMEWVKSAPGGAMVLLSMKQELRVQRLVEDYCAEANVKTEGWVEHLKNCISLGLAKKLGGLRVKQALQLLDEGKWAEVAAMMLDYYDKLYNRWASESSSTHKIQVECPTADASDNAERVLHAVSESRSAGTFGTSQTEPEKSKGPQEKTPASSTPSQHALDASESSGGPKPAWEEAVVREAQCHCGEIKITCRGEPRAVSYCHCSICRKLSGAPFSCQAVFPAEQVELSLSPGAAITGLQTSKGVERSRCASCMAPVRGTLLGGKMAAVPLALLTIWRATDKRPGQDSAVDSSGLRPQHHLYYRDRVMDVRDGLPKYEGSIRLSGGKGLLPESEW